jgi:hypothetical protein
MLLGGGRLLDHPLLLDHSGGGRRGERGRLHHGGHGQPFLDLHRKRLGVRRLGMWLRRNDPRSQGQALQRPEAKDDGQRFYEKMKTS